MVDRSAESSTPAAMLPIRSESDEAQVGVSKQLSLQFFTFTQIFPFELHLAAGHIDFL
ncbi:hypothetical protein PVAP13_3NG195126 [Panicum virgatum]|uniref:Uncharacterized protein n=1 Tax=Panicum virgatum TaxID=38727 RepID=A0A8T0UIB8_PANVG|nr:hypothetical protein PVAP13_3NG195126 [Panicum virgatum]